MLEGLKFEFLKVDLFDYFAFPGKCQIETNKRYRPKMQWNFFTL